MQPLPKVAFWFQQNLESETMITVDKSDIFEVDLSDGQPAVVEYNGNGIWSLANAARAIDYTLKATAKVGHK